MNSSMPAYEVKYLQHAGEKISVKVTVSTFDNRPEIHIHDYVFTDSKSALRYLSRYVEEQRALFADWIFRKNQEFGTDFTTCEEIEAYMIARNSDRSKVA